MEGEASGGNINAHNILVVKAEGEEYLRKSLNGGMKA